MLSCHQIDDIVKMKRNKMKKIVALVAVLFSAVVPVQSSSADQKSLVIIDSYFDSRVTIECVTASNKPCINSYKKFPGSITDNINHGVAMVEVAKKQNSSIHIIGLRASSTNSTASDVNAGTFIDALKWVNANSSRVSAVSVSRYFNANNGTCSPSSTNTANYGGIVQADKTIRELILVLKSKGIPVFASTGNNGGTKVDYPACIVDTNSVTASNYNKASSNSDTDFIASLPENKFSYLGTVAFGTSIGKYYVQQTTSSATVAVAAQYVANGVLPSKVVNVLP